ncbi:expressed unknown protein [Seminavis robusta]|uniref:Uncharacterized protein n=1 Tax=Seminavis robusta TaxID=568900 RepID=A0A9N8DLM4_9STRA|nr:expressed unknown protein [Seminavis robusta]|eukprot:Sro194_g082700.1 n/a (441) ;mRNA; f:14731-16053
MTATAAAAAVTGGGGEGARKRHVHTSSQSSSKDTTATTKTTTSASINSNSNNDNTSQAARLRQSIAQESKREKLQQRRIARMSAQSHSSIQKFYYALVLNALLVFMGGILYLKPSIFFKSMKKNPGFKWPPHHLAIVYPTGVSPRHDLPRFLNQYALATDENKATRDAVRHLVGLRQTLKPFQIFFTGWERKKVPGKYSMDDYCGAGFEQSFDRAVERNSHRHAEDLLHWCLLQTYQNDGFLNWNVTMKRSPISRNLHYTESDIMKGIVMKHAMHNAVHPALLWLPKKRVQQQHEQSSALVEDTTTNQKGPAMNRPLGMTTFDMDSQVPAKLLQWLIHTAPTLDVWSYPKAVEEYMWQLISAEGEDKWTVLDAVCDHYGDDDDAATRQQMQVKYQNRRIMAEDCLRGETSCCVIYMPQEEEDPKAGAKSKLRGSSSDSRD